MANSYWMSPLARHNSEPDLLRRSSTNGDEFMRSWNNNNVSCRAAEGATFLTTRRRCWPIGGRCSNEKNKQKAAAAQQQQKPAPIAAPQTLLHLPSPPPFVFPFFCRRIGGGGGGGQQGQQKQKEKQQFGLAGQTESEDEGGGTEKKNEAEEEPSALPQIRQQTKCIRSPFAPLPFDRRPWAATNKINAGGHQSIGQVGQATGGTVVCRDGDLLPSSWFSIDSEDLSRLHYKLQRRLSRRRSLSRANCPFGERQNPRRAQVMAKYPKRLRMRRALSEHQIQFMNARKDVEVPELHGRRGAAAYNNTTKRVSFSSPSVGGAGSRAALETATMGNDGAEGILSQQKKCQPSLMPRRPPMISKNNKSSHSLEELTTRAPGKPILARKWSGGSYRRRQSAEATGISTDDHSFRQRSGTAGSCALDDDFEIGPMDYATFKAWRRGSRLSIDVLNNAAAAAAICPADLESGARKSAGRPGLRQLGQVLKRMLADCLQQQQHQSRRDGIACLAHSQHIR